VVGDGDPEGDYCAGGELGLYGFRCERDMVGGGLNDGRWDEFLTAAGRCLFMMMARRLGIAGRYRGAGGRALDGAEH